MTRCLDNSGLTVDARLVLELLCKFRIVWEYFLELQQVRTECLFGPPLRAVQLVNGHPRRIDRPIWGDRLRVERAAGALCTALLNRETIDLRPFLF